MFIFHKINYNDNLTMTSVDKWLDSKIYSKYYEDDSTNREHVDYLFNKLIEFSEDLSYNSLEPSGMLCKKPIFNLSHKNMFDSFCHKNTHQKWTPMTNIMMKPKYFKTTNPSP